MISYLLQDEVQAEDLTEYVTGRERWKYHKRPLKPMMIENEEQFGLNEDRFGQPEEREVDEYPMLSGAVKESEAVKYRTVACQTIYRDSQTQTDPFAPDAHCAKDSRPEVLVLKEMGLKCSLPISMDEMYFIEDLREKNAFEGALPPTSDEACFSLRRKLMEEQEIREWKKRGMELKRTQNEKLNLLQAALVVREKDTEEYGAKRLEAIRAKKTEGKNRLTAKIQRRKIKILRKILKTRKALDNDSLKRDIVEEYHNFASRVYANITREGLSLDKLSNRFEVQPYSLQSYEAFEDLVSMIKPSYLYRNYNEKEFNFDIKFKYKKIENIHRQNLEKAKEQILKQKTQKNDTAGKGRDEGDRKRNDHRSDTPTVKYGRNDLKLAAVVEELVGKAEIDTTKDLLRDAYEEDNKKEEAIILLQRLILGRAIQNTMFEEKEKKLALIEELLIVSNIKELDKAKEQELLMEQHRQRVKNAFVEALQGEAIAETMELLSKELLRFKEEKKIAKFVKEAEDERRRREAEETGRRQAELTLRAREDVLYSEILKVHQGSVDSCLRKIFNRSIDHLATKQALQLTRLHKEKVENTIKDTKKQEVLIKDLVSSLLVPNISRAQVARKLNLEQQRYNLAVKETLDQAFRAAKEEMTK
jgi:hypothetical protein